MFDAVGEFFPEVGEQWIEFSVALTGDGQEMRGLVLLHGPLGHLSYCRWVIGRNFYSNMFSIIIFLDRYVPSSDCTCEVHSGGQAHVGQGQLAGGAWDHAGYHHQSPHYEAHCAYQVYKEHN